ncbi:hypothetical protein VTO73DRAFT_7729 [Trametes versicolor]
MPEGSSTVFDPPAPPQLPLYRARALPQACGALDIPCLGRLSTSHKAGRSAHLAVQRLRAESMQLSGGVRLREAKGAIYQVGASVRACRGHGGPKARQGLLVHREGYAPSTRERAGESGKSVVAVWRQEAPSRASDWRVVGAAWASKRPRCLSRLPTTARRDLEDECIELLSAPWNSSKSARPPARLCF